MSAPVAAPTVKENALEAVAATLSDTRIVKLEVPKTVGVPEITPVELFKDKPVGREPTVTVQDPYGAVPPVAAI